MNVLGKGQLMLRMASAVVVIVSVWTVADTSTAQNVIRDYFVREDRHYAPEDYHERGWIYRVQAGYAGLFHDCDDDAMKRYSPYIYWKQRPLPECRGRIYPNLSDAACEIQQGIQQFTDGAGNCARPNDCRQGPPRFVPTLVNGVLGSDCDRGSSAPALGVPVFLTPIEVEESVPAVVPVELEGAAGAVPRQEMPREAPQSTRLRPRRPIAGAPLKVPAMDLNEPRRLTGSGSSNPAASLAAQARGAGVHSNGHLSASQGQARAEGQASDLPHTANRDTSSRRR